MELKKILKYGIITAIFLFIAYFIIDISLYIIEDYLEANKRRIWVYNHTDDDIDISINNKTLKTINGKTYVMDTVIIKYESNMMYNYKIKANGKIILDEDFESFDISQSFSASGGSITEIEVYKLDADNYEIKFLKEDIMDSYKRAKGLKGDPRKHFSEFFNRDGLN